MLHCGNDHVSVQTGFNLLSRTIFKLQSVKYIIVKVNSDELNFYYRKRYKVINVIEQQIKSVRCVSQNIRYPIAVVPNLFCFTTPFQYFLTYRDPPNSIFAEYILYTKKKGQNV